MIRRMGSLSRTGSLRFAATAAAVVVLLVAAVARGDTGKELDECAEKLVGLSPCLTYVEGGPGAPTPDCCSGLKSAVGNNPKCLCVLVKDRDNPSLGFHINLTRALSLPSSCSAAVNISRCPELLNLAPNSPDAQIFKNLPTASTGKANSSSASDRGSAGSTGVHPSSGGGGQLSYVYHPIVVGGRWWLGVEHSFVDGLLLFFFMAFVVAG